METKRRRKRKLSTEARAKAVVLYSQGRSFREIALELGTNHMTIARVIREAGIPTAVEKRWKVKRETARKKALELLDRGVPAPEVAQRLGWSEATVLQWDKGKS